MIDVSELMTDPDFAQPFTIKRKTGAFANEGEWGTSETSIETTGVIQPAGEDAMNVLPEGERQKNLVQVWCKQPVYMGDGNGREADVIVWNGNSYRVGFAKPWGAHGYHYVVAVGFPT